MRGWSVGLALLAAVPGVASAQGGPLTPSCALAASVVAVDPSVVVCVNGEAYQIRGIVPFGKLFQLPTTVVSLGNGASFSVQATFDPDPSVNFVFGSVLPFGFGPLDFDVFFVTPVIGGPYNHASSSGTLGVTANGSNGATGQTANFSYPAYISGYADVMNLGVDTGTGVCAVSTPPTPNSVSCNPPGASNTFAPITPLTLTARLNYTHATPAGGAGAVSTVGWTGGVFLDVTAVPEPSTVSLVVAGVLVLAAAARRRRA
jgi:hypothetical protein